MTTGEKIRNRRLELNMTMEELGSAIGVQRSAINKYEKGLVDIKSKTLQGIANALFIPVKYLLDDDQINQEEESEPPQTAEARILAKGIDSMPKEQREAIVAMMMGLYPNVFKKGNENDDT